MPAVRFLRATLAKANHYVKRGESPQARPFFDMNVPDPKRPGNLKSNAPNARLSAHYGLAVERLLEGFGVNLRITNSCRILAAAVEPIPMSAFSKVRAAPLRSAAG